MTNFVMQKVATGRRASSARVDIVIINQHCLFVTISALHTPDTVARLRFTAKSMLTKFAPNLAFSVPFTLNDGPRHNPDMLNGVLSLNLYNSRSE